MSTPDLWFARGPKATSALGTVPGTGTRYAMEASGPGVWAVTSSPVVRQQRDHPGEAAVMPDALLNGLGYLLGTVAGVQLPVELMSVVERGPDVLNFVTHPHEPALIRVLDIDLLALRRSFGALSVYTSITAGVSWVVAMCPTDEAPDLIAMGI